MAPKLLLAIALAIVFTGCSGSKDFPIHTAKRTSMAEEVPTDILALHLKGLGREATSEEMAVIKHAIFLMRHNWMGGYLGSNSTLRSIGYRSNEKMWHLFFVSAQDDGNFTIFLRDDTTNLFSLQHHRIASRAIRFELKDE